MALSRPFVLAVVGALLAVATFASLRSAADRAQAEETPAAPTVVQSPPAKDPATSTPAKPGTEARPEPKAKAKPKAKKKPSPVSGVPPKVGRALAARRTVVLFFRQPAADDAATAGAVRSVRGMKGVSVFSAPISQLGRYRRVVATLGVSQAPAVVVVGKDRKARLLEGFIDSGTLRQGIKDQR
jgi:hypothetical protein